MNHVWYLAHGLIAAVICAAILWLAGLALAPRRWYPALRSQGFPTLGLGLYVLICWIAVSARQIPLNIVIPAFAGCVLGLSLLRARNITSELTVTGYRDLLRGVGIFAIFYVITYTLTWPPARSMYLFPGESDNLDLVTHARFAKQLLRSGSGQIEAATFDYRHSPAVSFLLGGFALPFRWEPIAAAMPLQMTLTALCGFVAYFVSRSVFRLSALSAVAVGLVVVTNPYLRDAAEAYRLAVLVDVAILLLLLATAVRAPSGHTFDPPLAAVMLSTSVVLLLSDSFLLPVILVVPAIVAVSGRSAKGALIAAAISLGIVLVVFGDHVRWTLANASTMNWRPASILTIAALFIAAILRMGKRDDLLRRVIRGPADLRLASSLIVYFVIALVFGSVVALTARERSAVVIPASWSSLADLESSPFRMLTLKIERDPRGLVTAMTRYWLPNANVQVLDARVRVRDLPFESISRQTPMIIQNFECEGVGHTDVHAVRRLGCVLLAPPSLEPGVSYQFNRTFLPVSYDNMTQRELGGRWNVGPTLPIRLTIDPERARASGDSYINFFLDTFRHPGGQPIPLMFEWGAGGRRGETTVSGQEWVSVPVTSGDWTGNRLWRLQISIHFVEGHKMLFRELTLTESPRGRVVK